MLWMMMVVGTKQMKKEKECKTVNETVERQPRTIPHHRK